MIDSTAHDLHDAMVEPTPYRRDPTDWDSDEQTQGRVAVRRP